jgi:hypothetical protein
MASAHRSEPGALEDSLACGIAHLESLRQLALGAAHSLNNALTSILGEVRGLAEERGADQEVSRACAEVEREIARCARLTRALQQRGHWRDGESVALDLAALLRDLQPLLRDTISRSVDLAFDLPSREVWVRGRREEIELLLHLAARRLLPPAPSGVALRFTLCERPDGVELVLALHPPAGLASTPSAWEAHVRGAAEALARRSGIGWQASESARQVLLGFEAARSDAA